MYSESSVKHLLKDNPKILPKSSLDITKDVNWNMRNIRSQITQGILQGESIPKIADRLATLVPERNRDQMILHARTAMTSAQNAGRQERYKEAEALGIKFKKVWLATLDSRTRETHQDADGQAVEPKEAFRVGGYSLEYPGDPSAPPEETYNCRCTMITELDDYPSSFDRRAYDESGDRRKSYITEDTTYKEWEAKKKAGSGADIKPKPLTIGTNRFGETIQYSNAMMEEKWKESRQMINELSSEFETKLKEVSVGSSQLHGGGAVQISGSVMHLRNADDIATTTHEFAHTISMENQTKFGLYDEGEFWKEIKKVQREYKKAVGDDTARWISTYEHSQRSADEFMAEAFTHAELHEKGFHIPEKYGSDFTYSNKVLEIVKKYFGK